MPRRSAHARVAAVARKEVVDLARDRRTMLVTLLTAIAAGPIFLLLIFNLVASQAEKARDLTLPVVGREHAPALIAFLERQQVKLVEAPNDYDAKVRSGDLDVVLEIGPGFGAAVEQGSPARVHLTYDRSRDRARAAIDQTESLLKSSLELYLHEIDLRYNIPRYITWLIPSLGFIGTVIGIMMALNYAGDRANVQSPDMLYQVTERLGVEFATTLLALVQASILVFIQNVVQGREESALNKAGQYCLDNLINRLYSP